ncbi:PAS domain-containing protein [Hymenobacter ginkgonis]|uniref:PAS domain-containing protein n=1 Tax=Hymenobacter ginkgonis TaxID=2682976 RepID=UPI0018DE7F9B|nr:PAS domain-containing sensor histidine kinase [Hymenobacter ginkgonis]
MLHAVLEVSLNGVMLLQPLYEGPDESSNPIDFAIVHLNPAGRRILRMPDESSSSLLQHFPHIQAEGVFDFYCAAFTQGKAGRYDINYQHDGLDNYFHLAAQRSGKVLVVSFTDTSDHARTAVENALRDSYARERAANTELRHTQQQLQQLNEQLEERVRERTEALQQAQAGAELQRTRLERFFWQAPAGICLLDGPNLVYEMVNPAYQRLFPDRYLLGKPLHEAFPGIEQYPIYQIMKRVYETKGCHEEHSLTVPILQANGQDLEDRYFNFILQARYDAQGNTDGVLVFIFEITEQVRARQAAEALQAEALQAAQLLATQRESFYQVFEQTPALICLLRGPDHVLEYCNPAFQRLYEGRDMVGRPVAETQPEAVAQGFVTLLDQIYDTGEIYQAAEVIGWVHPAGGGPPEERYFDFTYQPLREAGRTVGISVFAFEVTEQVLGRKQVAQSQAKLQLLTWNLASANEKLATTNSALLSANAEVQHANQELAAANQQLIRTNSDLDNFIYTASHDLRTPITNIEGLLQALRLELPTPVQGEEVGYIMGLMQESINRFKGTIGYLTEVSSLQKEYEQPTANVYLAEIIKDVLLDLAPRVKQTGAQFDTDVAECPAIAFSRKNLRSVVYNLLSNAIKYRSPERPLRVQLRSQQVEDYVLLEVRDNGLGLDLARTPKLFGMFQRFHTHVDGSGLGLYMVKKMVENAGGKIEVQSQVGVGTVFSVYFK